MKVPILLFFALNLSISPSTSFSRGLCEKICYMTPWLCGICTSFHGSNFETKEEKDLKENLRPITKGHLILKAKAGHSRRTKIVGGTPVKQGESPWTVRYVIAN